MPCLAWLLFIGGGLFVMFSLMRWFEHVYEAVHERAWGRLAWLALFPPSTWMFPARMTFGRPTAVPLHEPVRGFGSLPKQKSEQRPMAVAPATPAAAVGDGPPPGTPAEFLVKPVVPPKKPKAGPAVDPDKLAKLKQKMREQGMLDEPQD
jgi:hypothetical protein